MKELEIEAIEYLIDFYESFIEKGLNEEIKNKAKQLYDATPNSTLVRESIINAFGKLFPIAYPHVESKIKELTKEEAKEILSKLKKLKKELEN